MHRSVSASAPTSKRVQGCVREAVSEGVCVRKMVC